MISKTPEPTVTDTFLAPLATLALGQPDIEGLVFWSDGDQWNDTPSEALESEEITFYAEGLLLDGFHMVWQIVALSGTPDLPDHIRLYFWQDEALPVPTLAAGWTVVAQADWTT